MRAAAALLLLAACGREPDSSPALPPAPFAAIAREAPPAPPDRIAFVRAGDLWTVSADGTGERQVTRLGSAAEPAWSPDRRWIAFTASVEPAANLYPRNIFIVRPDGGELRQLTPSGLTAAPLEGSPRIIVTGRAVRLGSDGGAVAVPGARVTAFGGRKEAVTGPDGRFQIFLPAGGGWLKVSGDVDGRRFTGWRIAGTRAGRGSDSGDLLLSEGEEDRLAAPAWSEDGAEILYQARAGSSGTATLRRVRPDATRDEVIVTPRTGIVAGPLCRGGTAWIKTSEGMIQRLDVDTRRLSLSIDVGISVPDALAAAPQAGVFATLRMDPSGAPALVLVRGGRVEPLHAFAAGEPLPGSMDFSPDGAKLVLDRGGDLWTFDLATKAFARLAKDGAQPVWHGR